MSRFFRSRLECCENYREVGNSCEGNLFLLILLSAIYNIFIRKTKKSFYFHFRCQECWPGTYGVDCKDNCPPNFYGKLCSKKCGCEACDRVTGCSKATGTFLCNALTKCRQNTILL